MEDRQLLGWMNLRVYPTFAMFIAFFMIFAPIFAFVSVSKWWSDNPGIDQIIQIGLLIVLISVSLFTLLMAWSLIFDMQALVSSMSAELASSDFGKTFKGFVAFGVVFTILILGTAVGLGLLVFSADFRS
jgi:hypothetical protein